MHSTESSNLKPSPSGPRLTVKVAYNPFMKWWQASLRDAETNLPYRATVAHIVTGYTYQECLAATETLLTTLGASWSVVDAGEAFISQEPTGPEAA